VTPPARVQARRLYLIDLAERIVWTFLEAFAGVLLLDLADVFELDLWKTAALAGLAAVLSLVKGLAAKAIGDRQSASTAPSVAIHQAPTP